MSFPVGLVGRIVLAAGLGLLGGCADLSQAPLGTASPEPSPTGTPTASPSATITAPAENTVVLSGFADGFNGLESSFVASSRLGVRALGVTTINLADGASPGRFLTFRTYDQVAFTPGTTFAIGAAPAAGTSATSGSSLAYSDNGKNWVSTGGGEARVISRSGNDTVFAIENAPMAPTTPQFLAGGASGSVTVTFTGTFTSYSF